jgi:5-methylcytosine-specific restriction endonuclease McrA
MINNDEPYGLHSVHISSMECLGYVDASRTRLTCWIFYNRVYKIAVIGIPEEVQAQMVKNEYLKEQQLYERILSPSTQEDTNARRPISESVRNEVWRRDQGMCVSCGSRERIEFDHIIPVSLGGGNTARNIELLCEACNRAKSNKIT